LERDKGGLSLPDTEERFAEIDRLYNSRTQYLDSAKARGIKAIGYLCSFVPPELMTAAGFLPVRITGDPLLDGGKASEYIEPNLCPYIRNCFELMLGKKYQGLDGVVLPAACDAVERIYGILSFQEAYEFLHFIHVPHTVTPSAIGFYRKELEIFVRKMEISFGVSISREKIGKAIDLHNENKEWVRKFYELGKEDPQMNGGDMAKLLILGMSLSAVDYNRLLKSLYPSLSSGRKKEHPLRPLPRILLGGCITDNPSLIQLIEDCRARVVVDDTCIGTKTYFNLVQGGDPLEALTDAYFTRFLCPRTYRTPGKEGFAHLLHFISEFKIDGVIFYYLKSCDPHGFDYPLILDILRERNIPLLRIEDDYRLANQEALKTRIEAFVESI
jgi:benzoyl-CoA reductase subunit C